jgi:hypothetical protein
MRLFVVVALALAAICPARADEDDPKMTRANLAPPLAATLPEEDDPKLARTEAETHRWRLTHDVPRFKLSYRYLDLAALQGGTQHFDGISATVYPLSWIVRIGLDAEFDWGGGPYGVWLTTVGASVGVQYPARVTPFLDARFVAGVIGGTVNGSDVASWVYAGGLETGIEIYYARRFYLSLAIGWMHPVFGGIDVNMSKMTGSLVMRDFANDTLTFKIGLGL